MFRSVGCVNAGFAITVTVCMLANAKRIIMNQLIQLNDKTIINVSMIIEAHKNGMYTDICVKCGNGRTYYSLCDEDNIIWNQIIACLK